MSQYFAKVVNNIVEDGIVADQNFIDQLENPAQYIETFIDGSQRANYAGIGCTYDPVNDVFYNPNSPYPSWVFSQTTWKWEPPIPMPVDENMYVWNEQTISWDIYVEEEE
jgi:hypothetical protein